MAEKNQTVGLLAPQHHRVAFFAFLVVLRISDEHGIAFALGRGLDALQNQRKERVGNIRNRDNQLSGLQRAQIFGCGVGLIAQLLDRLENPRAAWVEPRRPGWLSTRDTVAVDTRARVATS